MGQQHKHQYIKMDGLNLMEGKYFVLFTKVFWFGIMKNLVPYVLLLLSSFLNLYYSIL